MTVNIKYSSNPLLIRIFGYVFVAICPVVVGVRFVSRLRSQNTLGGDDWTILASLIFSLGNTAVLLTACYYGFGDRATSPTIQNKIMALRYFYLSQIFYKISINLTKTSFLLLYLRLSVQNFFRRLCWTLVVIIVAYMISTTFFSILQCTPIHKAYDKSIPGTCVNIIGFWYANASFSIATDVLLFLLPVPAIFRLGLPINQNLALMFVFALGTLVIISDVLRMTTLNISFTYNISSNFWALIECNIAIVCACLPMFSTFLTRILPPLLPAFIQRAAQPQGSFSYVGKAANDWSPSNGERGHDREIHLGKVNIVREREMTREDYILGVIAEEGRDGVGGEKQREAVSKQQAVVRERRAPSRESDRWSWIGEGLRRIPSLRSLGSTDREMVEKGKAIKLTTSYGIRYDDDEASSRGGNEPQGKRIRSRLR